VGGTARVEDCRRRFVDEWQRVAQQSFPEIADKIHLDCGIHGLWSDLYLQFLRAYDASPVNDDLIGRIYDYASWCFQQPQTTDPSVDLSSATAVGFVENLPLDQRVSQDLYRWLSIETFKSCKSLFAYHLSEEEYRFFAERFMHRKEDHTGPPRL
jgi:hypothetical protein